MKKEEMEKIEIQKLEDYEIIKSHLEEMIASKIEICYSVYGKIIAKKEKIRFRETCIIIEIAKKITLEINFLYEKVYLTCYAGVISSMDIRKVIFTKNSIIYGKNII